MWAPAHVLGHELLGEVVKVGQTAGVSLQVAAELALGAGLAIQEVDESLAVAAAVVSLGLLVLTRGEELLSDGGWGGGNGVVRWPSAANRCERIVIQGSGNLTFRVGKPVTS